MTDPNSPDTTGPDGPSGARAGAALVARADALLWAADHLEHWSAHMTTRDQRRAADWLVRQVRDEAVRVRDDLPDTPEGRGVASFQAACEERCLREFGEHDWKRAAGVSVGTYHCSRCEAPSQQNGSSQAGEEHV